MRGLSKEFLKAMREKLDHGRRRGYVGWDQKWQNCSFSQYPSGPFGSFADRLHHEITELMIALSKGDLKAIRSEAADVANLAMMIADIEGALDWWDFGG